MRGSYIVTAVFGLALVAPAARADEGADAKAIVARGIEAMGGEATLTRHKAVEMKVKGTVHPQGMDVEFSGTFYQQPPKQAKQVLDAEVGGMKLDITVVLNGDKGWIKVMGNTMELEGDRLAEMQEGQYAQWVYRLFPLVKEKGFTLAPLGEMKVGSHDAVGIKVSHKGHRDVDLYFDKKTGLLVKTQRRIKDDSGQERTEESFYHDYKDMDGLKRPGKVVIKRDGDEYLKMEVTEHKLLDKLADSEFAMP